MVQNRDEICPEIYERFVYDTRRNTLILSVSCRSVMNSARELVFAQFTRKSGIVWRITLPTTNSDGGMPGRMVLSQEPNESQTSLGNTTERYCSRPCAMAPACMKT